MNLALVAFRLFLRDVWEYNPANDEGPAPWDGGVAVAEASYLEMARELVADLPEEPTSAAKETPSAQVLGLRLALEFLARGKIMYQAGGPSCSVLHCPAWDERCPRLPGCAPKLEQHFTAEAERALRPNGQG